MTFVTLLGVEGARALAAELLDFAVAALEPLGRRADPLRALARYVLGTEAVSAPPSSSRCARSCAGSAISPTASTGSCSRTGCGRGAASARGCARRQGGADRRQRAGACRQPVGLALANGSLAAAPADLVPLFLHLSCRSGWSRPAPSWRSPGRSPAALRWLPVRRFEGVPTALAAAVAGGWRGSASGRAGACCGRCRAGRRASRWPPAAGRGGARRAARPGAARSGDRHDAPRPGRAAPLAAPARGGALLLALASRCRCCGRARVGAADAGRFAAGGARRPGAAARDRRGARRRARLPARARGAAGARRRLVGGRAPAAYRRAGEVPATFWTGVATGVPPAAARRGRPRRRRAARRRGAARPPRADPRAVWRGWSEPLGLAAVRPLLAGRRRASTLWELAARGGAPVAAVNWWATFPAEPVPGWWSRTVPTSCSPNGRRERSRRRSGAARRARRGRRRPPRRRSRSLGRR